MSKFPFYKQLDAMDCGPTCLRMVSHFYGKIYSQDFFREKSSITKSGVSLSGIAEAAEAIGMQTLALATSFETLANDVPLPCIAYWKQRHFVVVQEVKAKQTFWQKLFRKPSTEWEVKVADPAHGLITYSKADFMQGWINKKVINYDTDEGITLILEPTPEFFALTLEEGKTRGNNFAYLLAYFAPYRKIIIQLFIGLLVGSIIQTAFPFLMQSIVDYGVSYQNLNFIYLILVAQLVLFLSDTSVQVIRGWLLLHMTSRISIRLLSNFLAKLMSLSLGFFDSKNVGDILQRIQDNHRIETFLSTTTLNTLFSLFNLFIFGAILAYGCITNLQGILNSVFF